MNNKTNKQENWNFNDPTYHMYLIIFILKMISIIDEILLNTKWYRKFKKYCERKTLKLIIWFSKTLTYLKIKKMIKNLPFF